MPPTELRCRMNAPICVEFFGVARARADCSALSISTETDEISLATLVQRLAQELPELAEACFDGSHLKDGYVCSLENDRIVRDPEARIPAGATVLLFSADAGG